MNNPEYILVDELAAVAAAVKTELALPVLNYKYGYIDELNEMMLQWAKDPTSVVLKFPILWLEQPYIIDRRLRGETVYGKVNLRLFIIQQTDANYKAIDRMTNVYKPIIYPIYRSLLKQIDLSLAFTTQSKDQIAHSFSDRYYWGKDTEALFGDKVDCSIVSITELLISNNPNCIPSTQII